VTIYFCLIKYHRDNVLEMMSEKVSFLKKLLKNIWRKMVPLPRGLLQVIIDLDFFFLVSIVDSMASQNPQNWEFSLAHLPDDPIQFFQSSTSRRRMRDEAETSERRVQLLSDLNPQQFPLMSLTSL
jgi:hypothetical protein